MKIRINNARVPALCVSVLLACCFFVGTSFAQTAPFGFLDSAVDNKGNTSMASNSTLIVSGWAADIDTFAPVTKVQVLIDNKIVGIAVLGSNRADVAAFYGPLYLPSGWSATITLPSLTAGAHTVTAVASDLSLLSTVLTGEKTISVIAADLTASNVTVAGTPNAGSAIQVTDTTTNAGTLPAGWSLTRFYLNTNPAKGGTLLAGNRLVPALAASIESTSTTATTVTLPAGVAGNYFIVACANDTRTVIEDASNNCAASASITVGGADLTEAVTAPANGIASGIIQISDTLTNGGSGAASVSVTRFYLNRTLTKGGTVLGIRTVDTLASGAFSGPKNTNLTLPAGIGGQYYVLACANDTNTVAESNTANNCASASISVAGADLAETVTAIPSTIFAGGTIQINDTVTNQGAGAAGWSVIRYYLNTTPYKGGTLLGSRSIASLTAGGSSGPISTNMALSSTITAGQYHVVSCANDTNTVFEANTANNCVVSPVTVYVASKTVIVDPAKVATVYDKATCGTAAAACLTIADGVSKAIAGRTVMVYPGTYTEQVTITKNITLVSFTKNTAIIQAPVIATHEKTLVTIDGGATAVVIKDMTISGPVETDGCGDAQGTYLVYGIFVKNANATITGNQVLNIAPANSAFNGCQYGGGIRFGSRGSGFVGHSGTISNNIVTGAAKGGIVVDGDNTNVNVTGNTITGLNVVGVVGQNGIQISRGAKGTVDGNTISGFTYGATLGQLSAAGILVYGVTGGVTVTNNNLSGNDEGIGVYSDGSSSNPVQFASNTIIKSNNASNNVYLGIHIDPFSKGNTIWSNTALGNNGGYDLLDEHVDATFNDWWGTLPIHANTFDTAFVGPVFSY